MPACPRCQQFVDAQALACPTCRLTLKAHGHPGIDLFRAEGEEYLCQSCTYHEDDTCNFPQRPYARECTLYRNRSAEATIAYKPSRQFALKSWLRRNTTLLIIVGLILISLLIALGR